jgi:two-component system sensor histidine kinase UhpB
MKKLINVLVIEDCVADADYNVNLLQRAGYVVTSRRVETEDEMTSALETETWDLILSDYSMPQFTVHAALELYHAFGLKIPFIVLSGAIGEEKAVQLIKAGVHDYLLKDNMTRFISVVERELKEADILLKLDSLSSALEASELKYQNYLENAPDVVFVADETGRFITINKAGCELTGYSKQELFDMSVLDLILNGSIEWKQKRFYELLQSGSLNTDFELRHKDGSNRWFAVNVTQLSDNQFLCFAKDITVRKNAVLEVMKAREEMQNLNKYLMDARENERATVAMEIHDELGQSLTAIKIDLNWVLKNIADSEKSGQKISRIIEMTNDTIKKVQRISSELRPGLLDDLGLATAIEWYSDEFEQRTGVKCNLTLEDVPEGDERTNLALFRILQEALTNVIRHAGASSVCVMLRQVPGGICMVIEDDGIGISLKKITSGKSLGLIGMRERARQINGTLEFVKTSAGGTKIVTFIPFQPMNPTPDENSRCR